MFTFAIPVLHVSTVVTAEDFYCRRLGFTKNFTYRLPDETQTDPCYMGLTRDSVELHVSSFPGDGVAGAVVFLVVEDLDALHAELKARGVAIELEPTNQSWGNREMYVRDPAGNSLRFVQDGG